MKNRLLIACAALLSILSIVCEQIAFQAADQILQKNNEIRLRNSYEHTYSARLVTIGHSLIDFENESFDILGDSELGDIEKRMPCLKLFYKNQGTLKPVSLAEKQAEWRGNLKRIEQYKNWREGFHKREHLSDCSSLQLFLSNYYTDVVSSISDTGSISELQAQVVLLNRRRQIALALSMFFGFLGLAAVLFLLRVVVSRSVRNEKNQPSSQ
jgi:hypothetical protein